MANTSSVINSFQKFYANDGVTPLGGGFLTFFANKTTDLVSVFSDPALTVAQTNPNYQLDAGGRIQGDVRFSGTVSILIKDSNSATVRTDDDNVCFTTSGSLSVWDTAVTYSTGDIVEGSDGLFYIGIAASNLNNDPAAGASPTKWSQIKFIGLWNTNQSYLIKDVVQASNGTMYYAISAQSGNDPISSSAQWAPVSELLLDKSPQLGAPLSTNSFQVQWSKGADVASATALVLLTDGNYFDVTGTTTITSFNTTAIGTVIKLHFDAALILTHDATNLALPGGANITTAAGDEAEFVEYAAGDYRCTFYSKATGNAVIVSGAGIEVTRSERTSNSILVEADRGTLVDITANTFTQTFTAVVTLTNGWWCYYRNSGTGDVTLDPNSSETIDGLTTFVMYPGETRLIQSDGTNLNSVVLSPFKKIFTASGTFTKPPGYQEFAGLIWSAGASGERTNNTGTLSRGGAGGGCGDYKLPASDVGATETVTIGAGGAAVTTVAVGSVGGDTTLGSLVSAFAGNLWDDGGSILPGALVITNNQVGNYEGMQGVTATRATIWGGGAAFSDASANGPDSWYGGTAGGSLNASATLRAPGSSKFGGDGGVAVSVSNGVAGSQPGGGGGATQTGTQSGAGADGQLEIWGI